MKPAADSPWIHDRPSIGERVIRRAIPGFTFSVVDFPGHRRTQRHSHEHAGLTLALGGRYEKTIGHRTYDCCAGVVTNEPPGVTHAEIYHAPTPSMIVEITPAAFETMVCVAPSLREPGATRHRAAVRSALRAHREFLADDAASVLALEAAVLDWVTHIARRGTRDTRERGTPPWLVRLERRLSDDWRHTPSISQLATEANVHPSYLVRAFRVRFGCSVGDYLRNQRVRWAQRELLETDHSLASIAHSAGFYDQSHFARVFQRITGSNPGEYRRIHRCDTGKQVKSS
jgi:AraC family transcriptional regulator